MSEQVVATNGKPKIAIVISNLYTLGGTERVTALLSAELSNYYDCTVVTLFGSDPLAYDMDLRVTIHNIYHERRRFRYVLWHAVFRLYEYLQNQDIHVLMIVGRNNGLIPLFLGLFNDIKIIYAEHNTVVPKYLQRKESLRDIIFRTLMDKMIARYSEKIVLLTEKELGAYSSIVPHTEGKVCVIPNMVDARLLEDEPLYDTTSQVLCTVGRIEKQKGSDYLLEVAERVFAVHPDWQWHIYGGGEPAYVDKFKAEIQRRGLEGRVRLMGQSSDIYSVLKTMAMFVMTSRWEGLPMVLIEAKAKGLPIVSFDIYSGPSDVVRDGVDGYLVEPFDFDAMAEKINYLIEHPEVRAEFSSHARGNLDKFSRENIVAQWRELIDELLHDCKREFAGGVERYSAWDSLILPYGICREAGAVAC